MHVWKLSMLLVFFNKHFQCICLLHSGQRWMCEMHRNHIQLERERCVVKPCHRWSLHFDFCPQSWKVNPQRGSHRAVYQTNGSSESLASDQMRNPCGHGNVHVFVLSTPFTGSKLTFSHDLTSCSSSSIVKFFVLFGIPFPIASTSSCATTSWAGWFSNWPGRPKPFIIRPVKYPPESMAPVIANNKD